MGNSESSSSGANNSRKEEEEEGRGVSLSDVGKAAAVAAAGIAAIAIAGHQIRSSLPSQREEEGWKRSTTSSPSLVLEAAGSDEYPNWELPPDGYWKINTDFSGDEGIDAINGIGYIIRDDQGKMRFAEAKTSRGMANDSTRGEADAIYQSLLSAHNLILQCRGVRGLILESDNKPIVELLNGKSDDSKMEKEVDRIRKVMEMFERNQMMVYVEHVDRRANRVADHLAWAAKNGAWSFQPGQPCPQSLLQLLEKDYEAARLGTPDEELPWSRRNSAYHLYRNA